ncbi:MAG: hypothetical protein HDR08_07125 [Lachnospiraceae bacterium]|nr:hypothetical protein [Lachnospiraceae bacterium]MBD5511008.1 hypothetical protein [Lachnospiraceae bacterium]
MDSQSRKIALYGLSAETEKTLREWQGIYEVAGLLDGFRTSGEMYGKKIISLDHAVMLGIDLIVVVARPGSCKAITKRIGRFCADNRILLYDVRGKNLLEETRISYAFQTLEGCTEECLKQKIMGAEAVSFDLFDTLLMRRVPTVEDVYEHVNGKLQKKGICIPNFVKRRIAAEKELSRTCTPKLSEIYTYILNEYAGEEPLTAGEMAALEYETDAELLTLREDVCRLFRETVQMGKKVSIISDTYYDEKQIRALLKRNGMDKQAELLLSCEAGTGKTKKLYEVYLETIKPTAPGNCIHIGDDVVSDILHAEKYGICTCKLHSATELMDAVGGLGLYKDEFSVSDTLRAGMFASRIFNSPFQFERADKKITVSKAYDIGYLFLAPVITDFVLWFSDIVKKEKIPNIWFSSRDGYLIQKLYKELHPEETTTYFLTSRIAAIRAGVEKEDDILYVDNMKFSGSLQDGLKERFGITVGEQEKSGGADRDDILHYRDLILQRASAFKKNYLNYIASLNIQDGAIAFFDFVAKGTIQYFINRFVPNKLIGIYFQQLEADSMKDKNPDIYSFCAESGDDGNTLFDHYYILETILTAEEPSVTEFDENGRPIFAEETRSPEDKACVRKVQEGILDYFRQYIKYCPPEERKINRSLDAGCLRLIGNLEITVQDFRNLRVEDAFYHRMTEMTDIL